MMAARAIPWLTVRRVLSVALVLSSAWVLQQTAPAFVQAQGATLEVVKVDFVRTLLKKAPAEAPTITEEGTYLIAPDGTYRVDKRSRGERTAEIVKFREKRRIALNLDTRQAVIGSNTPGAWVVPPSAVPRGVPGAPGGLRPESRDRMDLGVRSLGTLTLRGTLFTLVFSRGGSQIVHTIEIWDYRAPDPRNLPVILEERFESPDDIDERRITDVGTARIPPSMFEVPRGFAVTEMPR
jgi:hypothetical protein